MALSKLAVRRLTKLADFMDGLPPKARRHFNMAYWIRHEGSHSHNFGKFIQSGDPMTCGTTACALGWAATVPEFRKAGLRIAAQTNGPQPVDAAQVFFDIAQFDAATLFGLGGCIVRVQTPKQWAKHCRTFLRAHAE